MIDIIMAELTQSTADKNASCNWRDEACTQHEQEMINKLKIACGIE